MIMSTLSKWAYNPTDSDNIRLEKIAAIIVSGACCLAGCVWTIMYYMIFGFGVTSMLPPIFVVVVSTAIIISHYTKNHYVTVYAQIACIMYITALIQWNIGGIFDSGFVLAWAFCGPIAALTFFSLRQASVWFVLYLINIFITVFFNPYFSAHALPVSQEIKLFFFAMNMGVSTFVVFIFARYFVANTMKERELANRLLLNILPEGIARTLKSKSGTIAEHHENVCVLFADIVGFTEYSSTATPEELVSKLDDIFRKFDALVGKYNLEKIKTIGDAYMLAAGIPVPTDNCPERVADTALEMHEEVEKVQRDSNSSFKIRIGIHCGPIVAGVIGHSKFAYDLWGDTVNVASRLEASSEEGKIHVSEAMRMHLNDKYTLQKRGEIDIKGKGLMETYYLVGRRN